MAELSSKTPQPIIDKTPRWFILSYDAGKEVEDWELNEKYERIKTKLKKRAYATNDFRYKLIKVLRKESTRKVEKMEQIVETTIIFMDPNTTTTLVEKTQYWERLLREFGKGFYFILAPLYNIQNTDSPIAYYKQNRIDSLNIHLQALLDFVKIEEQRAASKK